jgi:hypothetical protein
MELDALNVQDRDGISSKQTIISAVLEWKAQLVSIYSIYVPHNHNYVNFLKEQGQRGEGHRR